MVMEDLYPYADIARGDGSKELLGDYLDEQYVNLVGTGDESGPSSPVSFKGPQTCPTSKYAEASDTTQISLSTAVKLIANISQREAAMRSPRLEDWVYVAKPDGRLYSREYMGLAA